ncbi:MAG: peptide chain release factor 2 [Spirochaetes bacterium]|nr:MAG: peptide chain release factor 2 [Spirochaetota bacterium]
MFLPRAGPLDPVQQYPNFQEEIDVDERDFKECRRELDAVIASIRELHDSIHVDGLRERMKKLEEETHRDDFWKEIERATAVNQEMSALKKKVDPWDRIMAETTEARELLELASAENDEEILAEVRSKLDAFRKRFDDLETLVLLSGEDDSNNAFVTIHPGAGGTESQDWAEMLLRMYTRWAEIRGFKSELVDYAPGEEAGIKGATVLISGDYVYGLLKGERGIHRLVRISPFDANKRRHTSFASVEVVPDLPDDIDLEINELELRIDTYRASGAGGQHVNRTDSAVRITHLPTGLVVQCQNERSQHKNKAFAMKVLRGKIYELRKKESEEKKQEKLGEKKDISWGNQIRSYVFQPYTMVKDHRTSEETGSIDYVMDGEIDRFIYAYLKGLKKG